MAKTGEAGGYEVVIGFGPGSEPIKNSPPLTGPRHVGTDRLRDSKLFARPSCAREGIMESSCTQQK